MSIIFCVLAVSSAYSSESDLERLQTAFIQKIINYVEWPASGHEQFLIAVHENEKLFEIMKNAMDDKVINGKVTKVIKLDKGQKLPHVQVIYAHHSENLKVLEGESVLLITDDIAGLHGRAILNFFLEDGKLRFDINQSRAIESNLKINSRLLKLARQLK